MSMQQAEATRELERIAEEAREKVVRDVEALRRSSGRVGRRVKRAARESTGKLAMLTALAIAATAMTGTRRRRRRAPAPYLPNAALGFVGGLVAAPLMDQFFKVWSAVEARVAPALPAPAQAELEKEEPATVKAAQAIVGPLPEEKKPMAGELAHYAMSTFTGTLYGLLSTKFPSLRAGRGLLYGALVWLGADELAVPALRLGSWRVPVRTHAQGLFAHLFYGAIVDGVTRFGRSKLRQC